MKMKYSSSSFNGKDFSMWYDAWYDACDRVKVKVMSQKCCWYQKKKKKKIIKTNKQTITKNVGGVHCSINHFYCGKELCLYLGTEAQLELGGQFPSQFFFFKYISIYIYI